MGRKKKKLDRHTVDMYVMMLRREGMVVNYKKKLIVSKVGYLEIHKIIGERIKELNERNGWRITYDIQYKLFFHEIGVDRK